MINRSFADLLQLALNEAAKLQGISREQESKYFRDNAPIPPNVPLGDGRMVLTTRAGLQAIYDFGLKWRSESQSRKSRLDLDRTRTLALQVFGEALAEDVHEQSTDIKSVCNDLKQRLEKRLAAAGHDVVHSFPCHVFEDVSAAPFGVGPVCFWPRLAWLDYVDSTAGTKVPWTDRARAAWTTGEAPPEAHSLRDKLADDVIKRFAECLWVATVTVQGNDIGRSKERGRTAVRLALDALGVMLPHNQALRLRGPGDELRATQVITVFQVPGRDISVGLSVDRPRLSGAPNFANDFVAETSSYRDAAGKAIETIVSTDRALSKLRQRWCDGLFWFGEARRDSTDFMALVRYGMCLDILAKGTKASGITKLLAALFGIQPSGRFLKDGTTLGQTVKRIYDEGRSQLGHGGRPALLEDVPFPREGADIITSLALENYVQCLNLYNDGDNYEAFLRSIPNLRSRIGR